MRVKKRKFNTALKIGLIVFITIMFALLITFVYMYIFGNQISPSPINICGNQGQQCCSTGNLCNSGFVCQSGYCQVQQNNPIQTCGDGKCTGTENDGNCCIDCGYYIGAERNPRCFGNNVVSDVCTSSGMWETVNNQTCGVESSCEVNTCILHKISFNYILSSNAKLSVPKENIPSQIIYSITNDGTKGENVYIQCSESTPSTVFINGGATYVGRLTWNPTYVGTHNIVCSATISTGSSSISDSFSVGQTDWYIYETTAKQQGYLDSNSIINYNDVLIQQKATELFRSTPNDTTMAIFNYVYSLTYDPTVRTINSCPTASTILSWGKGICADKSILFSALARADGIPTKSVKGCALPLCNWYDVGCKLNRAIYGENGHAWNYMWVNGQWTFADATNNWWGTHPDQVIFSNEEVCQGTCNGEPFTGNCYWGYRCYE
jgi:hypothetical protein